MLYDGLLLQCGLSEQLSSLLILFDHNVNVARTCESKREETEKQIQRYRERNYEHQTFCAQRYARFFRRRRQLFSGGSKTLLHASREKETVWF